MKLLIRNLARDTTESDLRDMFEGYGMVQSCNLVLDKATGKSKGFGFVEMPRQGQAKAAMKNLNGQHVDGNVIRVKKAETKGKEPLAVNEEPSAADQEPSAVNRKPSASEKTAPVSPYRRKKR